MIEETNRQKLRVTIIGNGSIAHESGAKAISVGRGSINIAQVGNGRIIAKSDVSDIETTFNNLKRQISRMNVSRNLKTELEVGIEIMTLLELLEAKEDESRVYKELRNLIEISPDIGELVVSALTGRMAAVDLKETTKKVSKSD